MQLKRENDVNNEYMYPVTDPDNGLGCKSCLLTSLEQLISICQAVCISIVHRPHI